jgi:hypothetical protein
VNQIHHLTWPRSIVQYSTDAVSVIPLVLHYLKTAMQQVIEIVGALNVSQLIVNDRPVILLEYGAVDQFMSCEYGSNFRYEMDAKPLIRDHAPFEHLNLL